MAVFRGWTSGNSIDGRDIVLDLTQIAGLAKNDVVFVFIANVGPSSLVTAGDGTWTNLGIITDNSAIRSMNAAWKAMGTTPDTSVAIAGSGSGPGSSVDAYSAIAVAFSDCNVQPTPDLFCSGGPVSVIGGGVPTPPATTPNVPNALILVAAIGPFDPTVGTQTNYTQVGQIDTNSGSYSQTLAVAYRVLSGGTGVAQSPPPWSAWTGGNYIAFTLPVKPTTVGATATGKTVGSPVIGAPALTSGTIHYRSSAVASATAYPASMTLSFAGMNLQPNDIVALIVAAGINGVFSPAPSSPGWIDSGQGYKSTGNLVGQCFYKRMGATPDTSVVITGNQSSCYSLVAYAIAFSGIATSNELAAATTVSVISASGAPNAPAITPSKNGSLILVGACAAMSGAPGTVAGYTSPTPTSVSTSYSAHSAQASPVYLILPDNAGSGVAQDPAAFAAGASPSSNATFTMAFAPAVSVVNALTPSGLAVGSPGIDTPIFALTIITMPGGSDLDIDVGSFVYTVPAFGQVHSLVTAGITTGSPGIGAPVLSKALTPVALTVGSPAFTNPMAEASLFGGGLTLGSPQFSFAVLVQSQAIPPIGLTVGPLGLPSLSTISKVTLVPVGISTSPLGLAAGSLVGLLDPVSLAPSSPVFGAPSIAQKQVLGGGLAVSSPDLLAPTVYQVHGLTAADLVPASWRYGLASTLPQIPLGADEFDVGSPSIDVPIPNTNHNFSTAGITVGSPSLVTLPFNQIQAFAPPNFSTAPLQFIPSQVSMPLNNKAPSDNGQWLIPPGSPYSLVSDLMHSYTIAADGTIWRDGVLTQPDVIAVGIEKATSATQLGDLSIAPMLWAWGSFGWAYYMAGVWVYSPPPNLSFPSTILTVGSPAIGVPASKQIHNISVVGLTVGSPQIGSTTFHAESAPGSYIIWQSYAKLYDYNNNVWTFGLVNPQNASEAQVLRNGVAPYNMVIYASVIQIGAPDFAYSNNGVAGTAPSTGWVRTAHNQWWFDNGGTAMVPWPAAPNFTMVPAGITTARPQIGTGPTLTRHDALGFTVGSPDIGTATDLTTAPRIFTYVFLPAPIGINLGPGNIVVAWPEAGEINHLVAEDLNVWVPDIGDQPLAVALAGNIIGTTDKINPYIEIHSPSDLLYRASSGLEKAMADTDGLRLMATYAELIIDQWDPYAISSENLPYLAFATGVNLWEADWNDAQRRWWVANQWRLMEERGSLLGTTDYVAAVGQQVMRATVPPAKFIAGKSLTDDERKQYNSRFAQLRLYPYVARIQLPWLCYCSNFRVGLEQKRRYTNNGCFLGPLWKMYPTSADAGGRYTRTATIWDRGVETPITVRTVSEVAIGGVTTTWDEVIVPAKIANHYYASQKGKWPLPKGHPIRWNKYGIFLGIMEETAKRIIKIPRNGELDAATAKMIYQTIVPDNTYISVYPEHVSTPHPISARRLYAGAPYKRPKQFLFNKFLPTNGAFQYLYEVWYIFDPSRVPDYRRASVYMNHARFGIHKYTAEIKIKILIQWRKWYLYNGGFFRGHLHPPDTREIEKCRRAVTASMAVRDTVGIDTVVKRRINTNDSLPCDGTFTVGQYIDA